MLYAACFNAVGSIQRLEHFQLHSIKSLSCVFFLSFLVLLLVSGCIFSSSCCCLLLLTVVAVLPFLQTAESIRPRPSHHLMALCEAHSVAGPVLHVVFLCLRTSEASQGGLRGFKFFFFFRFLFGLSLFGFVFWFRVFVYLKTKNIYLQ